MQESEATLTQSAGNNMKPVRPLASEATTQRTATAQFKAPVVEYTSCSSRKPDTWSPVAKCRRADDKRAATDTFTFSGSTNESFAPWVMVGIQASKTSR